MRQAGLGGRLAGRMSRTVLRRAATAASWAPAPTRPGFGSGLCPRVQRSPPGAPGRRGREGPGLCAQVLRVPQCACVLGEPCVCSDAEPTPDLSPAPCLRPVSTAAGSKAGEQVCHPSHRDLPLLPGGSSVWRLVSRDSVRAWSSHGGGWEACGSPRPPWDGRPGWGHAGVTRGSHLVVASPLVTAHQ